jgi:hypothetical protein
MTMTASGTCMFSGLFFLGYLLALPNDHHGLEL